MTMRNQPLTVLLHRLNWVLRGWTTYFGHGCYGARWPARGSTRRYGAVCRAGAAAADELGEDQVEAEYHNGDPGEPPSDAKPQVNAADGFLGTHTSKVSSPP